MTPTGTATLLEKIKGVGGSWSVYTGLGSFLLYFLGYLVLRFQLSAWGVATDLAVLDERYFFAGARFVVYATSSAVNALLLTSPLLLIWWLLNKSPRVRRWRARVNYALSGVIFAILFIQLIEKKCFEFMNNLLVQPRLDGDAWLRAILLDESSSSEAIFFAVLLTGVAITVWLLQQARSYPIRRPGAEALLVFLVAVEVLLLPVNYGIVLSTRDLPRVSQFAPAEAWLVWEGKDKTTFLVLDKERKLVSIPNVEIKKLEITGVSEIFRRFFPGNGG